MTYLEAVGLIREMENNYELMKVTYKGISVWPLLRINIIDTISGNNESMRSSGLSAVKQVFSTLFFYNPLNFFKKKPIWLFAGFERRKMICGLKQLRVSGCVVKAFPDTLVIEKPGKEQNTSPRSIIPEKDIVSESWLLLFVHILVVFMKLCKIKLRNEAILTQALGENNIQFDYNGAMRILASQKKVFDLLLAITGQPRKVIIESPYTIMGYVWSLHKKGIPVIELQHGVLNDKHYAYNSQYTSDVLYPDEICVFGEEEYKYLVGDKCHYCKNVHKTGLYFLDLAKQSFVNDVFKEFRDVYEHIVLVAGQRGYENAMADYVRTIAKETSNCLYVYVPRNNDAGLEFEQENVVYRPGANIYEYMIWCDVHLTISSTTCLECQHYNKPTIFYNYAGMAVSYYSRVLKPENGVVYTESTDEYVKALEVVLTKTFEYKEVFAKDTIEKIRKVIMK